ncbi:D-2-hydroxyacid dehydrogenase [bacterium]|nr:MAG: D-2-hydroxyacid dehydrogenase [bacterium]
MERIVFLDRNAIRVPLRTPAFPHEWQEYPHTPDEQIAQRLAGATIAITNRVPISAEVLEATPSLRLIAVSATGFDHIDLAACKARGVTVCNVRHWSISVPDHVFTLTLALRRQLLDYRDTITAGNWQKSPTYALLLEKMPLALSGSTMGIIGYGALARRVEAIAKAFGMNVLIAEHKGSSHIRSGRASFEDVLRQSHVVTVLCPLSDQTRNLISTSELSLMRSDALLINCARGGIVDEKALAKALVQGTIAGAGTDVLHEEPPANGNPLLDLNLPNLIITPHIAWASVQSLEHLADQLIANMESFVAGTPQNLVN